MKLSNQTVALLLAMSIIILSCKKDKNIPINQVNMWDCHREMTWDSLKTKNALIGIWEWKYIICVWSPEGAGDDKFKGLTIEFKSDNTLDVKENGQIIQTSNWKVVNGDSGLFALNIDPSVTLLYGRILFCDNSVQFNHSYIDGCDNYFKRIE